MHKGTFKQWCRQFDDKTKLPGYAERCEHPLFKESKTNYKQRDDKFTTPLLRHILEKTPHVVVKLLSEFKIKFVEVNGYPGFRLFDNR